MRALYLTLIRAKSFLPRLRVFNFFIILDSKHVLEIGLNSRVTLGKHFKICIQYAVSRTFKCATFGHKAANANV